MNRLTTRLSGWVERYGGLGIAAMLLLFAASGAYNHVRLYNELRDFGLVTQGNWVSQRHVHRSDDPDIYEVTFEFWLDEQYYRVTQESQAAYDLYGSPGEPVSVIYSSNDPQQAQVIDTISLLPPFQVWLMAGFGLLMGVLSLWELRKKRRARAVA